MVVAKAYARYLRISPRKTREVIDLIRGEKVATALNILSATRKKAVLCVEKALRSAVSNARTNLQVSPDELRISKITADQGPTLKRYRAAAMGRATTIRHRTTHLGVELSRLKVKGIKAGAKTKKGKEIKKVNGC